MKNLNINQIKIFGAILVFVVAASAVVVALNYRDNNNNPSGGSGIVSVSPDTTSGVKPSSTYSSGSYTPSKPNVSGSYVIEELDPVWDPNNQGCLIARLLVNNTGDVTARITVKIMVVDNNHDGMDGYIVAESESRPEIDPDSQKLIDPEIGPHSQKLIEMFFPNLDETRSYVVKYQVTSWNTAPFITPSAR